MKNYTYILTVFALCGFAKAFLSLRPNLKSHESCLQSGICKRPHHSNGISLFMTLPSKSGDKIDKPPPPPDVIEDALIKAEAVIKSAGGCIDSISFGSAWKQRYPEFSRDRFQGTTVSSFNKLFKVTFLLVVPYCLSLLFRF